jgi:putative PIN family toxin of toxin-antitoxin system
MPKVLRVFVDTNVLYSGLFFEGAPRKLLLLAYQGKLTLLLSEYVLAELRRVIKRKTPSLLKDLELFLSKIEYESIRLPSKTMVERYSKFVSHKEDAPILASAILADADYVVSGDQHLNTKEIGKLVNLIECAKLVHLIEVSF